MLERMTEEKGGRTNLCPDQLGERSDELRRRVAVPAQRLFVDHLADGEPEGLFEALEGVSGCCSGHWDR